MSEIKNALEDFIPSYFTEYSKKQIKAHPELFFKTTRGNMEEAETEVFMSYLGKQFGFRNVTMYYPALVDGDIGVCCNRWPSEADDDVILHADAYNTIAELSNKNYAKLSKRLQAQADIHNNFRCKPPYDGKSPSSIKQICDIYPLLCKYITKDTLADTIKLPCFDYVFSQTDRHCCNMAMHINARGIYDKFILFDNALALSHAVEGSSIQEINENIQKFETMSMSFGAMAYNRKFRDFPGDLDLVKPYIPSNIKKEIIRDFKKADINEAIYECKENTGMKVSDKLKTYAQVLHEMHTPVVIDVLSDKYDKNAIVRSFQQDNDQPTYIDELINM